jgi:hypothetical protein
MPGLSSSLATAAAADPEPISKGILAVAAAISKIFSQADPRQVPAAQIEQAFEAAANNLCYVAQAGMITKAQAVAGMQQFLQAGIEYEGKANLGNAAVKGAANMTKVINDEIKALQALPPIASTPLDLAKARSLYQSGSGWYAASLQTATQLTDAYLTAIPTGLGAGIGDAASAVEAALGIPSEVTISGLGTIPTLPLLILGGGITVLGLILSFRRHA